MRKELRSTICKLSVMTALMLLITGCSLDYSDMVKEDSFEYAVASDRAFVCRYFWDGSEDDMVIEIPDDYQGKPIVSVGGIYGRGLPVPFRIEIDSYVEKNLGKEATPVNDYDPATVDTRVDLNFCVIYPEGMQADIYMGNTYCYDADGLRTEYNLKIAEMPKGTLISDTNTGITINESVYKDMIIDERELHDNYMMKISSGTKYTVVGDHPDYILKAKIDSNEKTVDIDFRGQNYLAERILRPEEQILYFAKAEGKYCLFMHELSGSTACFDMSNESFISLKNYVSFVFDEEPDDPMNIKCQMSVPIFGYVPAKVNCYVNDECIITQKDNEDGYYYPTQKYADEELIMNTAARVQVFADENATEFEEATIPAGTKLKRFRAIPYSEKVTDFILEDGRVMRLKEEYWFSEPTSIRAMLDLDGNKIDIVTPDLYNPNPTGFQGMMDFQGMMGFPTIMGSK